MALPLYLAMTSSEISRAAQTPAHCAYMACHFSPYGTGLSNFPQTLQKGALLVVNDRTPVLGHDPELITTQLLQLAEQWDISGILLDFQRPDDPQTAKIVNAILSSLSCPVGVSPDYANADCPIFLPPPPPDMSLSRYISKYKDREIWLEAAMDTKALLLTEGGCRECTPPLRLTPCQHRDSRLHCSYDIIVRPGQVQFSMCRTQEDLKELLQEAEQLGITKAVGLYQELGAFF